MYDYSEDDSNEKGSKTIFRKDSEIVQYLKDIIGLLKHKPERQNVTIENIDDVVRVLKMVQADLEKLEKKDAPIIEFPQSIAVSNFPPSTSIDLTKSNNLLGDIIDRLKKLGELKIEKLDESKIIDGFREIMRGHQEIDQAFAVRIASADLTKFVDTIANTFISGVKAYEVVGIKDSSNTRITGEAQGSRRALHSADLAVDTDWVHLTDLEVIFNNTTTEITSAIELNIQGMRRFALSYSAVKAGTPTDIQFIIQIEDGGGNWKDYQEDFLANFYFDDTALATQVNEQIEREVSGRALRIKVTATGTTSSNTFTLSNVWIFARS